ncbi:DUF2156 domain-containing protein [Candidatus Saccharibacteria bacterium]|nr:MAG: DUF2156 domain-containing protein [Candidatus Saccharibacteria bacterium]
MVLGVTWLLAPALAHEHYGSLQLISSEAASGIGIWYRLGDIAAGLLLLLAVLRFGVLRRTKYVGWALLAVAILSAIDGIFPDVCYLGHESCSVTATVLSAVHDVETVILAGVVALLSITDAVKRKRLASYGFVAVQLLAALLVVSGFASQQFRVVLQYVYAFSAIAWLAWYVDGYNSFRPAARSAKTIRRVAGIWVLVAGVATLVVALLPHLDFVSREVVQRLAHDGFRGEQYTIVAGVLMLYISRHVLRGERPALWLVLGVVLWQIVHYSLITPTLYAAVFYTVMFIALLYGRASFDRNVVQPSWAGRLRDVATVFGGILAALLLVFALETALGHGSRFTHDLTHLYDTSHQEVRSHEEHIQEHTEARLRLSLETLVASLGVITVWSLFRPRSLSSQTSNQDVERMRELLGRYSQNSEDYFKLWPTEQKRYFSVPEVNGMIAYRVQGSVAFMMADPVAATKPARAKLLNQFKVFARQHGWVICTLLVPDASRALYEKAGLRTMQIGSSAVISVEDFQAQTARDKWWRWQRNRARKAGWVYEALQPPHSKETVANLRKVSDAWLTREGHQEEGFALGYFDEGYLQECVIHVLRDESGEIVAFANQMPTFGNVSQATVDLIRFQPDMNGAMPAVLLHIIESLDPAVHKTFDLGFVPLARMDSNLAQLARRLGNSRFASAGLEQFKNKFKPNWERNYVAYDGDLIDLARVATNLEKLFAVDTQK